MFKYYSSLFVLVFYLLFPSIFFLFKLDKNMQRGIVFSLSFFLLSPIFKSSLKTSIDIFKFSKIDLLKLSTKICEITISFLSFMFFQLLMLSISETAMFLLFNVPVLLYFLSFPSPLPLVLLFFPTTSRTINSTTHFNFSKQWSISRGKRHRRLTLNLIP